MTPLRSSSVSHHSSVGSHSSPRRGCVRRSVAPSCGRMGRLRWPCLRLRHRRAVRHVRLARTQGARRKPPHGMGRTPWRRCAASSCSCNPLLRRARPIGARMLLPVCTLPTGVSSGRRRALPQGIRGGQSLAPSHAVTSEKSMPSPPLENPTASDCPSYRHHSRCRWTVRTAFKTPAVSARQKKRPASRFIGEHPLQDQPAPDFALERMNGERFRLSDHRGEVVVVNFWATWCPPCRQENPPLCGLADGIR